MFGSGSGVALECRQLRPIADRGHDAGWFRGASRAWGHAPASGGRETTIRHGEHRLTRRNRIESIFGLPKDWRRIAPRHDRCPGVFLSAIARAAAVSFQL